jgi:hypothetical protein
MFGVYIQPSEQQTSPRDGRIHSFAPHGTQPSLQLSTGVDPGTKASPWRLENWLRLRDAEATPKTVRNVVVTEMKCILSE